MSRCPLRPRSERGDEVTAGGQALQIRELSDGERSAAGAAWAEVEAAADEVPLACSWVWTQTWLEHYGDLVRHRFVVGERGGVPCAVALVTMSCPPPPARLRPRVLRLGTAGEPRSDTVWVERNGMLTVPGLRKAFAQELIAVLSRRGDWDRLEIDGFVPAHADALAAAAPALVLAPKETPVADLSDPTDVLERLGGGARRRARQTLNRFGELELDWPPTLEDKLSVLDELSALHSERRRDAGEVGAFDSARFTAFHRALITRAGDAAAVVRVRSGEQTVGCLYGLAEGRRMLFYQSGLRRYDDNKLRAGTAAHVMFMRACAERGFTIYDFLAPPDRYKRELATGADELVWGWLDRRTPRTLLWRLARQLRAAARGNAISRRRSSVSREMIISTPR